MTAVILLGFVYAIGCFILYHKIFEVWYFDLKLGIWREMIISMLVGVVLSGLTLYFWWLVCIILIVAAYLISSKSESRSTKQFIWIAVLVLCVIIAIAGLSMRRSLKNAENQALYDTYQETDNLYCIYKVSTEESREKYVLF